MSIAGVARAMPAILFASASLKLAAPMALLRLMTSPAIAWVGEMRTFEMWQAIVVVIGATLVAADHSVAQDRQTTAGSPTLYTVVDGYKVDPNTMNGFRAWRAGACDRCHGANQEGLVGPPLVESMKTLSRDDFVKTVRDGRLDKGMVSFSESKMVMDNIDGLYAYLKGRADGAITRAKVEELKQ